MTLMDYLRPEIILGILLVIFRIGGVFVASPLFSNQAVPAKVKLVLVFSLSLLLYPILPKPDMRPLLSNMVPLIVAILEEVTVGAVIGFVSSLTFAAVTTAGELFGLQLGFSIATIFDPANDDSSGVITSFYVILGALIFLYLDGHHVILAALAKSFQVIPLGHGFNWKIGENLAPLVSKVFIVGLQMAAPALVVLTVLNVIFGVLSKLSPQLNIYMNIGFVLGPTVGMAVLMVSLPLFRVLMTQFTQEMTPELFNFVRLLKG